MNESPIFTRTHDLLLWLIQATRKFPRDQRFGLALRINDAAFTLQEKLTLAAVDTAHTGRHLVAADVALNLLRKRLLLSYEMGFLGAAQYRHVSALTHEVGNLLGGWRRSGGAPIS